MAYSGQTDIFDADGKVKSDLLPTSQVSGLSLGELDTNAYRGDRGKAAYDHSLTTHAPAGAQANNISDINAGLLTGGQEISLHSHAGGSGLSQAQIFTRISIGF